MREAEAKVTLFIRDPLLHHPYLHDRYGEHETEQDSGVGRGPTRIEANKGFAIHLIDKDGREAGHV